MFLRRSPRPKTVRLRTEQQRVGDAAETLASEHLTGQGLRIVARNVRYPDGELDLIAWEGETLVFVEVRSRADERHGSALESVHIHKQRRVIRAAQHYLHAATREARQALPPCRFDVVAVDLQGPQGAIEWVRGAFDMES